MLNPHDIATLMVIQAGDFDIDIDIPHCERISLLERDLIDFDDLDSQPAQPRLTHVGKALLAAIGYRRGSIAHLSPRADAPLLR